MREYIIQQLRQHSFVRKKQKTWVSALTDEQLYQLFLRLRSGESAKSIARYVQKSWGIKPNSSIHSISQGVLKFKRRVAHLLLSPPSEVIGSTPTAEFVGTEQVEGTEAIEHIVQLQLERIHRMMDEEEETGVRHGSMSREIHALTALTKALMKAKEWDLVHEGNDPVRRRRLERMKRGFEERFRALVGSMDEEGMQRVLKASEMFLEDAERHAVEAEVGPDGKLQLVKPDESPNDNHTQ